MKTNTRKIGDYESEVTVEYEAAELEKAKKRACKQISERANIPGFRKGKVPPIFVIEQHLGKGVVLEEAADILIQQGAGEVVNELNLIPVTEMKHNIITCEDGKDFVFTLTFTPYPEVKLGEYKGLEVEKVVEPVTDEDVNEQLEHLRNHHANMIDAAADDEVAQGDFITLDFVGTVNGEKFEGGEGKDFPLEIGSHKFIDNFEDQLVGLKVGGEKDVKVTFPEDYNAKDLAGKPAVFHCKIDSIKHKELPALDDAFAKKASKFETLDEFKADIRKNMEASAARRAIEQQQQGVIDKAIENMTVDLPPVMIEDRITQMLNELDLRLQSQGMRLEQYMSMSNVDMDTMRENHRETARKDVLTDILLDEIARVEDIKATNQEVNYEIAYMATMYRTTPKQVLKVLTENRQLSNIYANVRRQKVMRFLFENMAKDEAASDTAVESAETKVEAEAAPAAEKPAETKTEKAKAITVEVTDSEKAE